MTEAGESGPPPGTSTGGGGTSHPAVDRALSRLDDLAGRAPADQVEVYDDIHRQLQEALTEADAAVGAGASAAGSAGVGISAVARASTPGAPGLTTDRR